MKKEEYEKSIEFDRNYCEHYAPQPGALEKDSCALGCGASERMKAARDAGEPNMSPCIGGHKVGDIAAFCAKWERRSLERAKKRAEGVKRMIEMITVVMPVVNKWRTWTASNSVSKQGVIECP